MHTEFAEKLKLFMKGMKRHVAAKKMEDGDSGIIGKKKMGFKVYEKNCELFMKEEGEEFIFACCFLTLEWNLIARSESIVFAHLYHIPGRMIALFFALPSPKQIKQAGTRIRCGTSMPLQITPRHVQFLPLPVTYLQTLD